MSEYSVELKGLNKVYSNLLKEDTIALKDINLQIRPGEFISIIGPSGYEDKFPVIDGDVHVLQGFRTPVIGLCQF